MPPLPPSMPGHPPGHITPPSLSPALSPSISPHPAGQGMRQDNPEQQMNMNPYGQPQMAPPGHAGQMQGQMGGQGGPGMPMSGMGGSMIGPMQGQQVGPPMPAQPQMDPNSKLSQGQMFQLRNQIMAYRYLARNQAIPEHVHAASQGRRMPAPSGPPAGPVGPPGSMPMQPQPQSMSPQHQQQHVHGQGGMSVPLQGMSSMRPPMSHQSGQQAGQWRGQGESSIFPN